MKPFLAFLKKEGLEQLRTGRLLVLGLLFVLFGIMNPAIAKLTPWMLQAMSASLSDTGITVTNIEVNALSSWTQYYKNLPIALLVFVLMTAGAFTAEYQKGTLVLVLTKGLKRAQVLAAKALSMLLLWTGCSVLYYAVTYGYTAYFWDQAVLSHIGYAAFLYYLFGVWLLSVMVLFSTLSSGNTGVLLGTGGILLAVFLLGLFPPLAPFLPLFLTDAMPLLTGTLAASAMGKASAIALGWVLLNGIAAVLVFRKRSL